MIAHKHITKFIAVVMALAVFLCLVAVAFSGEIAAAAGDSGISMEYETELFNTDSVISINILMDDSDWDDMLSNATSEEYYECDVEINGTTFYRVAIRPKGNTSLTSIASDPTTDRYSFKLEFDHYVDGQTCFGLDKLILNNNYADATNMKEALVYDMYQYLGADASLYNYASISVNGEYWGVYLALEAVEDSFMLRNYGAESGELYKPEGMNMGGGGNFDVSDMDFGDMDLGNMDFSNMTLPDSQGSDNRTDTSDFSGQADTSDTPAKPDTDGDDTSTGFSVDSGERPSMNFDFGGGMGGFSMGGDGADLNYTDDDLDSYSTIWEGEITKTKDSDHERVVTALKNISEGNDLETYMDTDNLLRYMAVHVFSVNEDSLSGAMAHNYYLYESDGKLNLIPWDYNLSFGGMGGGNDATEVVNEAIDNAFSGTDFFDTLMDDESYHARYYAYLQQLVSEYINGGGFDAFYNRVRSQIDSLVENDPTAFYSYDEYLEAVDTLYQVVKLRGESIQGQLDGTIPSTSTEQRNSDALIDASDLDLSVMGSMNTGGVGDDFSFDSRPSSSDSSEETAWLTDAETTASFSLIDSESSGSANFDPSQAGGTQQTDGESQSSTVSSETGSTETESTENAGNVPSDNNSMTGGNGMGGDMPSMGDFPSGSFGGSSDSSSMQNLILYGISLLVLIAALVFAILYRRRPRRR